MTNLKPVNIGMNRFCGPAVLSILTGKNTDECVQAIRRVYPTYAGAEVPYDILLRAADKLGYDTPSADTGHSLYGTIIRLARQDGIYVIMVPGHVVTIEVLNKTAYFCDNQTKEPIPASSSARLGQRVIAANKFVERPKPKFIKNVYSIDQSSNTGLLRIYKSAFYENPSDNTVTFVTAIPYDSMDELRMISEALLSVFTK